MKHQRAVLALEPFDDLDCLRRDLDAIDHHLRPTKNGAGMG